MMEGLGIKAENRNPVWSAHVREAVCVGRLLLASKGIEAPESALEDISWALLKAQYTEGFRLFDTAAVAREYKQPFYVVNAMAGVLWDQDQTFG